MAAVEVANEGEAKLPETTLLQQGQSFVRKGDLLAAERCFRQACEIMPKYAMSYNNLGWVLAETGKLEEAIGSYKAALIHDPGLVLARVNLATLLSKNDRLTEAVPLWDGLCEENLYDREMVHDVIECALKEGNLPYAAKWAAVSAELLRGSGKATRRDVSHGESADVFFTPENVVHDIEQMRWLSYLGFAGESLKDRIAQYETVLRSALERRDVSRRPLTEEENDLIGETYGRIWHQRQTPVRDPNDLWGDWNAKTVEDEYFRHPLGLCVIDDFLSEGSLGELRRFCLESTIWFGNRYSHGRLGAFFREGFNCPLLIQLTEDLRSRFSRLIGDEQKLLQLWGFKYNNQPVTHPHADFAAVNMNFWLTETEANLDPSTGGLVVYDTEAPRDWSFESYNRGGNAISSFLREKRAQGIYIPYRANRAILFNSDLFHATAPVNFKPGYQNQRVNVTMLFGRRSADLHGVSKI